MKTDVTIDLLQLSLSAKNPKKNMKLHALLPGMQICRLPWLG